MPIDTAAFRVPAGEKVKLARRPTQVPAFYQDKADYQDLLAKHVRRMAERQNLLYAHDRYALLLIFQAMDAAGKDSMIKHVMSGINPQGCQVFSFKHPSPAELAHDFLWRTTRDLPERGKIGIFNRSYYEEVLIARVHPDILKAENLPEDDGKSLWERRFRAIRDLEWHLHNSGTRIIKFFLHISREEQRKRFLARIDDPDKNWKFNSADVEAQPAASDDDMVTVTFTIAEGPQQVLRNVEVTGNDLTNQKVVNEALHFELGKPVDLDEWAKARKRLYDTNVFRLVDIQPIPAAAGSEGSLVSSTAS